VLVTHDRFMLDRLATDILGLDGAGGHNHLTDYAQYQTWVKENEKARRDAERADARRLADEAAAPGETRAPANAGAHGPAKKPKKKLTLAEQKEYDAIEERILAAEHEVQRWQKTIDDPATLANGPKLTEACEKMHAAQEVVAALYKRWEELEAKLNA
jgi:ATP-binding cassette subfamily F protein uup